MTTQSNARRFTRSEALLAGAAAFGLFVTLSLGLNAQEAKKDNIPDDKAMAARSSIEVSGYTRPGNPDDKFNSDGELIRQVAFVGEGLKKFKIMGGTVYFAVFRNTGLLEGDTFGTGMKDFDAKFEAGRSFKDSMSPRYDTRAKYLYLYQVVNDRNLDPRPNKGGKGNIKFGLFDPNLKADANTKIPVTEDIASFSLKLITDPRYITSWGHFKESGFAAKVADVDETGKVVKQVVDKVERDVVKILPISFLPAIVTKLSSPAYSRRARSHSLGELESGFGVADRANANVEKSKAFGDIKLLAAQLGKENSPLAPFAQSIMKVGEKIYEPEYVQLMYLSNEERAALNYSPIIPGSGPEILEDEITRAIFRVDWRKTGTLKQGARSAVFGFTTDLPPVSAPIRIDTPKAAGLSEGMRLANYFAEDAVARGIGTGTGIALTAASADALALALGTSLGSAVTPVSAPAEAGAAGFAGMTGGFGGLGGMSGGGGFGGGGGGLGFPALAGGLTPGLGGGFGGGGGIAGGTGGGTGNGTTQGTPTQTQGQTGSQAGSQIQTINFNASLLNQQLQAQLQAQSQNQHQHQSNHNNNHNHNNHGNHGHVVPAPASLLLGLLGLPGLWFLRRRKTTEAVA